MQAFFDQLYIDEYYFYASDDLSTQPDTRNVSVCFTENAGLIDIFQALDKRR